MILHLPFLAEGPGASADPSRPLNWTAEALRRCAVQFRGAHVGEFWRCGKLVHPVTTEDRARTRIAAVVPSLHLEAAAIGAILMARVHLLPAASGRLRKALREGRAGLSIHCLVVTDAHRDAPGVHNAVEILRGRGRERLLDFGTNTFINTRLAPQGVA